MGMARWQSRGLALVVMLVVVFGAAVGGTGKSLAAKRAAAVAVFERGSRGDGLSIAGDLADIEEYAQNLAVIARRYLAEAQVVPLLAAAEELREAKTVAAKYRANEALYQQVSEIYTLLCNGGLTETDAKYARERYQLIVSKRDTISHDAYNEAAEAFNQLLMAFPARLLASLAGLKPVELYG